MAVAGVLATALNTAAVRTKALWVGGVDVLKEPATPSRYGVPIETVRVSEVGPGAVSSMSFTIEDTALAVNVRDGMDVTFQNLTQARPYFRGYVDSFEYRNREGDQGRYIDVTCTGVEALLDWTILAADFAIAAGSATIPTIQVLASIAYQVGLLELRPFQSPTSADSSIAYPLTNGISGAVTSVALTLTAGTTLRDAITSVLGVTTFTSAITPKPTLYVTVDFYMGLRVFEATPYFTAMVENVSWNAIDDTAAGNFQGEPTLYGVESATVRAVYMKGTGFGAYVTDGSGKVGQTAFVEDLTLTTLAACQQAAAVYLAQYGTVIRGTITYTDIADTATSDGYRPGNMVTILDTRVGLDGSTQFRVAQIDREFNNNGRMSLEISYGARAPSVTQEMRRLTRKTRS